MCKAIADVSESCMALRFLSLCIDLFVILAETDGTRASRGRKLKKSKCVFDRLIHSQAVLCKRLGRGNEGLKAFLEKTKAFHSGGDPSASGRVAAARSLDQEGHSRLCVLLRHHNECSLPRWQRIRGRPCLERSLSRCLRFLPYS
ncbi:MAG: hypothetical protein JWL59_3415 [Chthoniobacteraceae bacterium]|nr:hypothetical protein [Chthoniobacteraceae bacterium]